jgi:hypothetical protein
MERNFYLLSCTNIPTPLHKIGTISANRSDDPMIELTKEARKSVVEFIEFVYNKYGKKVVKSHRQQ